MLTLIKNIKSLIQTDSTGISLKKGIEMGVLPSLNDAYVLIENDLIKGFGHMGDLGDIQTDKIIDASEQMVLPTWCDSHTHIVYAGNREQEFIDRINGMTYEEIANRGGGILNSAKSLQKIDENELFIQSAKRLEEIMQLGTGAVEIKSGYGLELEAELKMLRVIKKLDASYPISIRATYLGAHALPAAYKNDKQGYVNQIITEGIPRVAEEGLASYIDVFCETGYFSVEDTERILEAGQKYGLTPKIHVNQFTAIGGVQAGIKYNALSVDHLELVRNEDIATLKESNTMPVALPSCSYFLGIPYTPARKMIDADLPLALASDYNPGSTPSGNMNFVVSTACIKMNMTPEEAINAATINGAFAMGLENSHGSIRIGKKANLIISEKIPSYGFIPYAFGRPSIDKVMLEGRLI